MTHWIGPIQDSEEYGVLFERYTSDKRVAQVCELIFGAGQISVGPARAMHYTDTYMYETIVGALEAMESWEIEIDDELAGWVRHLPSGRRRPHGDISKEYIAE